MALEDTLARIPGLGGYLAQGQYDQRQALGNVQGAIGLANIINQMKQRQMEEQLQPHRIGLMQAQAAEAQRKAAEAQEIKNALGAVAQRARAATAPQSLGQDVLSGENIGRPGMPQEQADEQMFRELLTAHPALSNLGMQGLTKLEATATRRAEGAANRDMREREGQAGREAHLERLKLSDDTKRWLAQMNNDTRLMVQGMIQEGRRDRASSGGMTPGQWATLLSRRDIDTVVDGVIQKTVRDNIGNIWDTSGKHLAGPGIPPEAPEVFKRGFESIPRNATPTPAPTAAPAPQAGPLGGVPSMADMITNMTSGGQPAGAAPQAGPAPAAPQPAQRPVLGSTRGMSKHVGIDEKTGRQVVTTVDASGKMLSTTPLETISPSRDFSNSYDVRQAKAALARTMQPHENVMTLYNRFVAASQSGDNSQANQVRAQLLAQMFRSNNQRFKGEAATMLGGGELGGSIVERIENSISQWATGRRTAEIDRYGNALAEAAARVAAQDIADSIKNARMTMPRQADKLTGPKVYGPHIIWPDGDWQYIADPKKRQQAIDVYLQYNGGR